MGGGHLGFDMGHEVQTQGQGHPQGPQRAAVWLGTGRFGPITHVGSDSQQIWINLSQYMIAEPAFLEHFKSYPAQTKKHAKRFSALT